MTAVPFSERSISSMSPLMAWMVIWSGAWMLYQMHRLLLFCATTTSLLGTHCTYVQKFSSCVLVCSSRL